MASEPAPEVQEFLEFLNTNPVPPTDGLSVESARERLKQLFEAEGDPEPVARVDDFSIRGPEEPIPVRLYHPEAGGPNPLLIYLHGGGFMLGDLDATDGVCRAFVNEADCAVLSVDYRLAPEDPFPAGLLDCYAAAEWAVEYGDAVNVDPERIAVGGASAGGNLAASVSLLSRDRGGPELAHQLLIYPGVRAPVQEPFDSFHENAEGYLLERDAMEYFRENYLRFPTDARNEYAWPMLASDLSGLPRATVVTAGFDPLRDEGQAYADRLGEDGVDVTHREYETTIHGFVSLLGILDGAREAIEFMAGSLRETFEP